MFERAFVAVVALMVSACPSRPPSEPTHPRGSNAQPDAAVVVEPPVDDSSMRCDALVAHAIGIYWAELSDRTPAGQLPTPDEIAKLKDELRADPACKDFSREVYDCAMAAKTLSEYGDCRPEQ